VILNQITWAKPDPPPNALHTAFTHARGVYRHGEGLGICGRVGRPGRVLGCRDRLVAVASFTPPAVVRA
jgi:hypothetical protein